MDFHRKGILTQNLFDQSGFTGLKAAKAQERTTNEQLTEEK
jgi:hypothetical protein